MSSCQACQKFGLTLFTTRTTVNHFTDDRGTVTTTDDVDDRNSAGGCAQTFPRNTWADIATDPTLGGTASLPAGEHFAPSLIVAQSALSGGEGSPVDTTLYSPIKLIRAGTPVPLRIVILREFISHFGTEDESISSTERTYEMSAGDNEVTLDGESTVGSGDAVRLTITKIKTPVVNTW